MKLIRNLLLRFKTFRRYLADYQRRQKEIPRHERGAEYFVVGGAIRRKPKRW